MEYSIHRLKEGEKTICYLFMSSAVLDKYGYWPPDPDAYEEIWKGTIHGSVHHSILDQIYTKFNVDKPAQFRARRHHSLSVGDIVSLTDGGKTSTYFCDSIGWTELPEFFDSVSAAE